MHRADSCLEDKWGRLCALLDADPDVLLAYLFGSRARGEAGPLSDIDLAVYLKPAAGKVLLEKKLSLLEKLTAIFAGENVDLVILNEAPLVLKYNIFKDSKALLIRDSGLHDELVRRIIAEYLDFKPLLARHYEDLQKRIEANEYAR